MKIIIIIIIILLLLLLNPDVQGKLIIKTSFYP